MTEKSPWERYFIVREIPPLVRENPPPVEVQPERRGRRRKPADFTRVYGGEITRSELRRQWRVASARYYAQKKARKKAERDR